MNQTDKPGPFAPDDESTVAEVRRRYAAFAGDGSSYSSSSWCSSAQPQPTAITLGYDRADLELLPDGANLGLGCGAPLSFLDLAPGETVLDLGSGPGLDAILAARRVGPSGRVIGVDMTPEMLARARAAAETAGLANVELREGRLEALPVADASIDAITSNCVINLVPDKAAVFREMARVLRPGGRAVISDVVLTAPLPEALRDDILAYVGCVAGAMVREAYLDLLRRAGFGDVRILKEVDFLGLIDGALPDEAAALLEHAGVGPDQIVGRVLSITYRASL